MMLVSFLHRQTALQRDAQTGAKERLLNVVRGQSIAGEQNVQVAVTDEPADMFDTAGVNNGGTKDSQNLLASLFGAFHGGSDLAHRYAFRFLAGNRTGHELKQVRAGHRLGREDTQSLSAHDDAVTDPHFRHRNAAGGGPFRIDEDAAVHLLIFHIDPFTFEAYLRAEASGAVKSFGESAVHISGNGLTIADGDRCSSMIVDSIEDFTQLVAAIGADLNAGVAGIGLPLTDANVLDDIGAAVCKDFIQYFGQNQRIDDVPLNFNILDEPLLADCSRNHERLRDLGITCGITNCGVILSYGSGSTVMHK